MNAFWVSFWSNFFANISVVFVLSVLGYMAKGKVIKNLKSFIDKEVVSALFVIEEAKDKKPKSTNDIS